MKKLIALMVMLSMFGFTACKGEEKKDDTPVETESTMTEPVVEEPVLEEEPMEPIMEEPMTEEPMDDDTMGEDDEPMVEGGN